MDLFIWTYIYVYVCTDVYGYVRCVDILPEILILENALALTWNEYIIFCIFLSQVLLL